MRKYFLEFSNPELEIQYQKQIVEVLQRPVMKYGTFLNVLQQSIAIILSIYNSQTYLVVKSSVIIILNLITYAVIYKMNKYYRAYFHIWNIFLILASDDVQEVAQSSHQGYLFGVTIMSVSSIALLCVDFKDAIIQLIIQMIGRSLLCVFYSNKLMFNIYTGYIIIGIIYAKVLFINKKFIRDQFYLTQKDQQWKVFLPMLIRQPMFIFMFQEDELKFTCQSHFNIDKLQYWNENESVDINFKQFIRSNYNLDKTLENLLFNIVNTKEIFAEIQLRNKNQILSIKVLDLGLQNQSNYLMVIDSNNNQIELVENKSSIRNHLIQYSNCIHQLVGMFKKRSSLMMKIVFQATISMYNPNIRQLDCIKLTKKLAYQLNKFFKTQISIQEESQMLISTYFHKFKSYLVFIFLILGQSNQKHVYLKFQQNQFKDILMQVICNNKIILYENLKKQKYFQYLENKLLVNKLGPNLVFEFYNMKLNF